MQRWEAVSCAHDTLRDMSSAPFAECMRPPSAADQAARSDGNQTWSRLRDAGVCPTCREIETGAATADEDGRLIFEDERSFAVLERFPRGLGHTIVIAKPHIADITDLPEPLGCQLMTLTVRLARALAEVTGCEKVYQVTMCSGPLSHLHFQLIPRLPGEQIGGGVFSTERMVLESPRPLASAIKAALKR